MFEYKKRIVDNLIIDCLNTFGGVLIDGPKACGKSTSAAQISKSSVCFEGCERENLLLIARNKPEKLLEGENPRLIDEWQDAPSIWDAVRFSIDQRKEVGLYVLTGSSSEFIDVAHTGTGRISTVTMWPMSLYESEESNGSVSLSRLFDDPDSYDGAVSDLTFDDLVYAICRGGWPQSIYEISDKYRLNYVKDVYKHICTRDIVKIDKARGNGRLTSAILKSYARSICNLTQSKTIASDVMSSSNIDVSPRTVYDYLEALKKLYIIDDVSAWNPQIRSKTAMHSAPRRTIVDPSIAVAALDVGPKYFDRDYITLGYLFESLCMRDLKVYSSVHGGTVSYYHDRYDLEVDCVLHMQGGRYALIEFKLGQGEIEKGVAHLCEVEKLIIRHNERNEKAGLRTEMVPLPDLKIVLTGTKYGMRLDNGVFVVPIGCLKD